MMYYIETMVIFTVLSGIALGLFLLYYVIFHLGEIRRMGRYFCLKCGYTWTHDKKQCDECGSFAITGGQRE